MKLRYHIKTVMAGLVAASVLAFGATAQAVSLDAGVFAVGNGDVATPIVMNVSDPGGPGGSGFFIDAIQFDLGPFTHFNMTSTSPGITGFVAQIFQNIDDAEISDPLGPTHSGNPHFSDFPVPGYTGGSDTFTALGLPDLGLHLATPPKKDYHLHPAGTAPAGVGYTLTLWGSNAAPVPVPAAVYLFGTGLVGLAGLVRRKMAA